jgi:hypothetical protein
VESEGIMLTQKEISFSQKRRLFYENTKKFSLARARCFPLSGGNSLFKLSPTAFGNQTISR